jgi:uroporphyrinogen decarboxylase
MNHKERGLAPFRKTECDRFPMWFGGDPKVEENVRIFLDAKSLDEALYDTLGIDYKTIRPRYNGKPLETFSDGSRMTEWGIKRGGSYWGQSLTHPLHDAETLHDVNAYKGFPDPDDFITKFTEEQILWAKDYCLIAGSWAPFFHESVELIDMEEFFVKLYTNPAVCEAVIERCFEFNFELDRRVFEQNKGLVDMYFIGNDFGSQRALLMSPDMWRKYYKPYLAKLMEQAKNNGCVTAIHSCGDIHEIIGDLIEIGVDAINPVQVSAANMSPEKLISEFGDACVFFGGIDEVKFLQFGTEEESRTETRRIIDILGKHNRYIVAASHDYLLPEIPAQNIVAMFDEAKKYGCGKKSSFS